MTDFEVSTLSDLVLLAIIVIAVAAAMRQRHRDLLMIRSMIAEVVELVRQGLVVRLPDDVLIDFKSLGEVEPDDRAVGDDQEGPATEQ
jgi:hypothetical protein